MATNSTVFTGESGSVKFTDLSTSSVVNVASVRSFSIDQTLDTIESTVMGAGARTFIPGLRTFSGSMDLYWREDSTAGTGNVNLFDAANEGTTTSLIELYPSGETTGIKLSGAVIITSHTITSNFDGMVEASCAFQGTAGLTKTNL